MLTIIYFRNKMKVIKFCHFIDVPREFCETDLQRKGNAVQVPAMFIESLTLFPCKSMN